MIFIGGAPDVVGEEVLGRTPLHHAGPPRPFLGIGTGGGVSRASGAAVLVLTLVTTSASQADKEEQHRLTTLSGLAALSLDTLSSVAYGPEAIVVVLVAAGSAGLADALPVTYAIVILLAVLVISYRQVIEAFPSGGGAYAVARTHLGTMPSLVAAGSLIVDYVLNAAVGVSAGVAALTSAFPGLYGATVPICLIVLALITAANLWGVAESARLFIVPTLAFIFAIALVIVAGLVRSHPVVTPPSHLPSVAESVGALLLLRAFASGCSALTGVEAIANAVPSFRKPRAKHAQNTEAWLGALLGAMLIGLAILIKKYHVTPDPREVQPARPWQRILHNQRGFVLDRAIQRGTVNVVICRLHFQLANWPEPGATSGALH
ncbi:MAG TPA: APC family permease [Nitrolancea sp.]|nr:APC family permease [Nitrolancea sp.]